MRKVVHRILSALPMFALAFLALLAAADHDGAERAFSWWSAALSDQRFFWLCVAGIIAYAVLWWATSMEPKSRHAKLVENGLRPICLDHQRLRNRLDSITTDDELPPLEPLITKVAQDSSEWISFHMGEPAVAKYLGSGGSSFIYFWAGQHNVAVRDRRSDLLNWLTTRIENLEKLMQSDSWTGPPPNWRKRGQQWRKNRAERHASAV